jgi:quercetin dioxygenase-like cupin family protein
VAEVFASYREAIQFSADRFNPITLAENERARTILACFEPGQFIPVHAPSVDLSLVILEGTGRMVAGDQEISFQPGSTACIAAGEARGLKADTQTVAFFVVTPPPTAADHTGVTAGLRQGSWQT